MGKPNFLMIGKQEWLVIQERFAADDDGLEEENMEINDKDIACLCYVVSFSTS